MKKYFSVILQCTIFSVCFLISSASAAGWEKTVHVEWGYTSPTDLKVSEFVLYQDNVEACVWKGAEVNSGDCKVNLSKSLTSFTMAARFENNSETPKSAPFPFTDLGPGVKIIILIGK